MSKDYDQPRTSSQDNGGSTNSKGKAKDASAEDSDSITNKLQASGRLVLNAFGRGPDLSGQAPAGKASSNSINNVGSTSSSAGEASSHRLRSTVQGESLRSRMNIDNGASAQAFDDFVTDDSTLGIEDTNRYQKPHPQTYDPPNIQNAVSEQEKLDGAAIVDLLNGPSEELDAVLLGAEDPNAEFEGLTTEAANKLREALFPTNSVSSGPRLNDLLNFNPDFLSQSGAEADFERQLHLGTTDTNEARSSWLQQWDNVLNGYANYVWGDLEPLIAEARREVEDYRAQGSEAAPDTKALDRLRQVLAHVRGF
ncbi:hypothetical protein KAF25_000272 [Fusarium avenaceum]|uniref:Uncharacterized protein n=1 Tax=Fusarium avenaceum TaxID=40199 RepID=A0A9P7GQQ4_9HYPO|nr:hypothetical protein KAF25_000272 [Fusarium avenaceum]